MHIAEKFAKSSLYRLFLFFWAQLKVILCCRKILTTTRTHHPSQFRSGTEKRKYRLQTFQKQMY